MKLLCAADLHLGRRPSRLPESPGATGVSSDTAWQNLVDHAVTENVDAVLLAGDVIDEFNRSFEAYGPLERGLTRLSESGIPVVAVAGNHDFDTLPDVASELGDDRLVVLGKGGSWERWTLEGPDGRPRVHVDGWSFPSRHVRSDPTVDYTPTPADGAPVVGLLHCDLDAAHSDYAPASVARLRGRPVTAWVLGHVHAPDLRQPGGAAPILYSGSLQALDPGEEGVRGGWIIQMGRGREPVFRQLPLSATHYATVSVDLDGLDDPSSINARIRADLAAHLRSLADRDEGHLRFAHCRTKLVGRTPLHSRLAEITSGLAEFDPPTAAEIRLSVDPRLVIDTRPALDLESLARADDAAGLLAEVVLALGGAPGHSLDEELISEAVQAAEAVASRGHYQEFGLPPLETGLHAPDVRDTLRRQAVLLLDAAMAGRGTR